MTTKQDLYFFGGGKAEGDGGMRDVLGGKGAGLAEMTNAGVPVPPGFTIATTICIEFMTQGGKVPERVVKTQKAYLDRLESLMGKRLGDPQDPLLVSVRSGAKFSMPGMMDTILNLGLNDQSVEGLIKKTGNPRFGWDCYRRFISMFGNVVLEIPKRRFEDELERVKHETGARNDAELSPEALKDLANRFKTLVRDASKSDFPEDPGEQLDMARDAVFRSWNNPRAIYYRKQNKISDDLGTAVNVQAMVFGNMGNDSATGVGFTRNPATGDKEFYGEYLTNAQGEDVVAGIRTPKPIRELEKEMPAVYRELREITARLEQHYRDVQDFEFTVEHMKLYLLQTRTGKRTGAAAVKMAVDMVNEGLIDSKTAVLRVPARDLDQLLHPRVDPAERPPVLAKGLPASPGAAVGRAVFLADDALEWASRKEPVILIRAETNPDDIHGMDAARGILTATGGMTSHAAVVARGMGKPCVAGCSALAVDETRKQARAGNTTIKEGDWVSLDGSTGEVMLGQAKLMEPTVGGEFATFMRWADEFRRLGVRANADVPRDAKKAIEFGAEGIGLCRTEHMFFGEGRIPIVREMILSAPEARRAEREEATARAALEKASGEEKKEAEARHAKAQSAFTQAQKRFEGALNQLLPLQRDDFKGVFRAMAGRPVTIRTLDPPLHEFLPKREELMVDIAVMEAKGRQGPELDEKRHLLERVEGLHEFNPMLGHRGCRLGITFPEITAMQARAIIEAALDLKAEGVEVKPEIMIPLVGTQSELVNQRSVVEQAAEKVMKERGATIEYLIGTMIEVPRAAVTANEIAEVAQFFSFGTNDLTQMTYGISRDDIAHFLPHYIESGIFKEDPFVSLDRTGVGDLMRVAVERGKKANPKLKVGICGEHGGDPDSVFFCHRLGLDYVSCSPFRLPIARLAAAQAALSEAAETGTGSTA
jgi:pyruvate, orthophosphate dikinase